ncbi:MAG: hypothetical protein FJ202_03230 [Gemmatimonadetes bacterium]|nr:hypothetical protein [Gemmatimonadota bacterium]
MKRTLSVVLAILLTASASQAQYVDITLNEWKILSKKDTVKAGRVTFQIKNTGSMAHALRITGEGVDKATVDIARNGGGSLVVTLKPGTYELWCPLSDDTHKVAGMTRKFHVVAATETKAPGKP